MDESLCIQLQVLEFGLFEKIKLVNGNTTWFEETPNSYFAIHTNAKKWKRTISMRDSLRLSAVTHGKAWVGSNKTQLNLLKERANP
jgi:hypothetical protein